ncbi:MAG: hypothetical protein JXB19_11630 [Bacteroidales bacterium]|nr:hypothetical protein [Bacteroidales bacterium]
MTGLLKYTCFIFIVMITTGCARNSGNGKKIPVARVYDTYLYLDDLKAVTPAGLPTADSIAVVRDFIDKWVRNQLILKKAELYLTDEEKDVEQQIEDYRTSLLVYVYEQSYIRQNLDTVITDREILEYLNENPSNFLLSESVVKGSFIQVPVTAPEIYRLRQWCNSDDEGNTAEIETYCFQHAERYDHFDDRWVNLSEVLEFLPGRLYNPESTIRSRRLVEMRDSTYYYFLTIRDYALAGEAAPVDLVSHDIRSIILNKRKIQIVNELESDIYNDGQNRGYFTIY